MEQSWEVRGAWGRFICRAGGVTVERGEAESNGKLAPGVEPMITFCNVQFVSSCAGDWSRHLPSAVQFFSKQLIFSFVFR